MENLVLTLIIVLIIGAAGWYIYKEKKNGSHCIGCPHSKTCKSHKCNCEK